MASFIGEYRAKIDDKGRLILPSPLKSIAERAGESLFIVRKGLYTECLELYLNSEWEKILADLKSRLNFYNREDSDLWRNFLKKTAYVTPDEKLGRINIPNYLLEEIGAVKEIVFFGAEFKIEIWAKESWESSHISSEESIRLIEKRLG